MKFSLKFIIAFLYAFPGILSGSVNFYQDNSTTGWASYYHGKFEGRRTASGEIFKNDLFTAAHKTLPFRTVVRVTNLKNQKEVIVRINDRLPKNSSRIIDLSKVAASELDFIKQGLTKVSIEVISEKPEPEQDLH
jgi:rare lipoprotein A